MNRRQLYRLVHPLRGCGDTRGDALYRDVSPNGDKGCNNQHLGARHVPATMLPQLGDNTHILFTATPPQCADATTTLHSPLSTLHSSYTFSAKERDSETSLSYFGARYYSSDLSIWLSVDPMSDKYPSMSPYTYCVNNPIKIIDPNGEAWKPTINEYTGECTGYEWVMPQNSYESDGKTLKKGLYKEAIFFSDNGTYDSNNEYNIGTSTATVYKADGSKKVFKACTHPSDASKYATVPGGTYIAKVGEHRGHHSRYMALKLQGNIELGMENPAYKDHRTYASGIDIHKPGSNNFTGIGSTGPVSEGCLLIDGGRWQEFLNCFSPKTEISVTVSRTMSRPTNMNVKVFGIPYPLCPPDATRTKSVRSIF